MDHDFPLYLWDKLLPQAELTINLLRQSNANPKISAHAHLFGPFDFNRFPLAPLGCAVQVHVPPERRLSWGERAQKGWYIGCALDHYRLHTFVDQITRRECVSGAVEFKHKSRTNPHLTHHDNVMRAYQDLLAKVTGKSPTPIDAIATDKVDAELPQLCFEIISGESPDAQLRTILYRR